MADAPRVIHDSEYYRVERLENRVIRVVRLSKPFAHADEVERASQPVQKALDRIGRAGSYLLIDSRAAVGRNDPGTEKNMAAHRKEMKRDLIRVAILVETTVGVLHSKRLLAEDGTTNAAVFTDEAKALAYLKDSTK